MNIYLVDGMHLASPLPTHHVFKNGLDGTAIVGQCRDDGSGRARMSPGHFIRDTAFVELMHDLVSRETPRDPAAIARAASLGGGSLQVLDQRITHSPGMVSIENVIGEFQVKNGSIVANSYRPNS